MGGFLPQLIQFPATFYKNNLLLFCHSLFIQKEMFKHMHKEAAIVQRALRRLDQVLADLVQMSTKQQECSVVPKYHIVNKPQISNSSNNCLVNVAFPLPAGIRVNPHTDRSGSMQRSKERVMTYLRHSLLETSLEGIALREPGHCKNKHLKGSHMGQTKTDVCE